MNPAESVKFIIGIDGGATQSLGILLDDSGKTIDRIPFESSSLTANENTAPQRISKAIDSLCDRNGLKFRDIEAVGLGLAGTSNETGRDKVFRALDRMQLSSRSVIMSDAEAAYEITCPGGEGILVSIGTGVICMARDDKGDVHRTGGHGHDVDHGSGFWIGKEAMLKVALSNNTIHAEPELMAISNLITRHFGGADFSEAVESAMTSSTSVAKTASLCSPVCHLAAQGNDVALAIVQEATMGVADLILELAGDMDIKTKSGPLLIAGNGSVIKNPLYRNCLRDALKFDIPELTWVFSEFSPAYGAAMLAGRFRDIHIKINSIIEYLRADPSHS